MFSNLSSSSISLATVTPSFVTVGAPNDLSRTTFRPFGPSVTVTASARTFTPRRILSRASCENLTIFAAIGPPLLDDAEDVLLAQNQMFFTIQLDFGSEIRAKKNAIAPLHIEGRHLAVLVRLALADRDDLALLRLFLRGVGDDDASLGLLFLGDSLDQHSITQRPDFHDSE